MSAQLPIPQHSEHPAHSQPPLRVLQIHNFYQQQGGEDVVVRHEADLLRQAGVQLTTWYLHSAELAGRLSLRDKIRLAWQQCWNSHAANELKQRLKREPVDVIHVHNLFPLFSPAILHAAQQAGVPVVLTIHNFRWCHPAACIRKPGDVLRSLWTYVGQPLYRQSRWLTLLQLLTIALHRALRSYQRCATLLCPSNFVRDALLLAGFSAEQLVVKAHSTLPVHQPDAATPTTNAQQSPYLLFVGRGEQNKGLGFLLDLWRQQPGLSDITLKVAGVTAAEAAALIGEPLPAQVQCVGFVSAERLAALYQGARLLVVPSLVAETFGNVVIEAFSYGTPCLVSDLGALPELVQARHNITAQAECSVAADAAGAVFKAGDSADFWQKLSGLLAQPEQLSRMGQSALQRYLQYYQPRINQQALIACYQQARQRQGK